MGKGSVPRPFDIPRDQYRDNFDAIFGKKDKKEKTEEVQPAKEVPFQPIEKKSEEPK